MSNNNDEEKYNLVGSYDITFCSNFDCPHKRCRRHQIHLPSDIPMVTMSDFKPNEKGECNHYWEWYD